MINKSSRVDRMFPEMPSQANNYGLIRKEFTTSFTFCCLMKKRAQKKIQEIGNPGSKCSRYGNLIFCRLDPRVFLHFPSSDYQFHNPHNADHPGSQKKK